MGIAYDASGLFEYRIDCFPGFFDGRHFRRKLVKKDKNSVTHTLLERIAAGEKAAVAECIDQYGDLVWSLARRFCSIRADAEDAVQEIFTDIWSHADRYDRNIAKEITFVAMIARRRLIDRLRRVKRRPETQEFDETKTGKFSRVAETLEHFVDVDRVAQLINSLKPDQKQVLELSLFLGHTHSEISSRLRMPLGTVKTHLRRGLIAIRGELASEQPASQGVEL